MRIAYFGWFLREGFRKAGCDVTPLPLDATRPINALLEETGADPDVVFLELFGKTALPKELFNCRCKLAAYCIDSPLNEYWLIPLTRLFDHVYVDQLSSVPKFRRAGVQAKWLPLCVSEADFRPATDKTHLITFVGRLTPHRIKRANILDHIGRHFPINVVSGVSNAAMLDIFASSRIVLNEHFFSGLNLRFFQALASGALLLTERTGYGIKRHFQEGKHYLGYAPNDLVTTIGTIAQSPELQARIAACGQEECRRHHTSEHRARTVLRDLAAGRVAPELPLPARKLHEGQSKYAHAIRFGGRFDESVALLKDSAGATGAHLAQALCLLGSIHLRLGNHEAGVSSLEASAALGTVHGLNATLKLMLFFADDPRFFNQLSRLLAILKSLRWNLKKYITYIQRLKTKQETYYNTCILAYALSFDQKTNYDLGFYKEHLERFPDYALEYAVLAFATKKSVESLAAIIACATKAGIAPESLGYIKQAILVGAASDEQIALSVSLALEYYDFSYAEATIKALKATFA